MESRVYEYSGNVNKLKMILESEAYAEMSFARQGYKLKEGKVLDEEEGKYYLYLKGDDSFFKFAEEKFKDLEGLRRASKEVEERVIRKIEEEESSAEQGLGSIFG